MTSSFSVEVFDCYKYIYLPHIWSERINNETVDGKKLQIIDAKPSTLSPQECPINSYSIATKDKDPQVKLPLGIEIDQESGKVTVDRNIVYQEITIKVVVKVNTQTFEMPSIMILK